MQRTMQMAAEAWKEANISHGELLAFNVNKPENDSEAAAAEFNAARKKAQERYDAALERMTGVMQAIERNEDKSYDLAAIPVLVGFVERVAAVKYDSQGEAFVDELVDAARDLLKQAEPNSSFPFIVEVMRERQRQIDSGHTIERDRQKYHGTDVLLRAAACLAAGRFFSVNQPDQVTGLSKAVQQWPEGWPKKMLTGKNRRQQLVSAAALLLAELERLDPETT